MSDARRSVTLEAPKGDAPPANVGDARASASIVDGIRLAIRHGQLRPGDRLPSEGDLSERFHVSRVVVREALRVLESTGLIDVKVGARGGAFVAAPTGDYVGTSIADLISLDALTAIDVVEARTILEVGIVVMACRQATSTDIADLLEIHERSERALRLGAATGDLSAEFHSRIARATHNSAIVALLQPLRGHMKRQTQRGPERDPDASSGRVREHKQLVMALIDRDATSAAAIMTRHLGRIGQRQAIAPST